MTIMLSGGPDSPSKAKRRFSYASTEAEVRVIMKQAIEDSMPLNIDSNQTESVRCVLSVQLASDA